MSILSTATSFIGLNKWYFIAGAVGIAFASGGILGWHEKALRVPAELEAQKSADVAACITAQNITKEKNDELVKARDRIFADAARYKLQHPNACVHISDASKLQPGKGQHATMYGVNSDTLRDYAALCETYRSELIVCSGQN